MKYRVTLEKWELYDIDVEANSKEMAEEKAEKVFEDEYLDFWNIGVKVNEIQKLED